MAERLFAVRGERPDWVGVHPALFAALRSRIRALKLSGLLKARPVRLMCFIEVFAASVRAFVTHVTMRTSISGHGSQIVFHRRSVSGMSAPRSRSRRVAHAGSTRRPRRQDWAKG